LTREIRLILRGKLVISVLAAMGADAGILWRGSRLGEAFLLPESSRCAGGASPDALAWPTGQ